jgi:hypothetical protein
MMIMDINNHNFLISNQADIFTINIDWKSPYKFKSIYVNMNGFGESYLNIVIIILILIVVLLNVIN